MNYYSPGGQMELSDRIAIETGICNKDSFKKIAKLLRRHPTTIAHEVKENRTFIRGNYPNGKDCKYVRVKHEKHVCGDQECDKTAANAGRAIAKRNARHIFLRHATNSRDRHMSATVVQRKNSATRTNISTAQSMRMQLSRGADPKADEGSD